MSLPSSPSSTPSPSSSPLQLTTASLIPSPLRSKKSKVELPSSPPSHPLKPHSARALNSPVDAAALKQPKPPSTSPSSAASFASRSTVHPPPAPLPHEELVDTIDQQLCLATMSMSINFMERDSQHRISPSLPLRSAIFVPLLTPLLSVLCAVVSLFQELSASPSTCACLPLVRSIKNKLIGSELNKRLVLSQELDLTLLHLLRDLVEEDQSSTAELRLELMTALASLAANHTEGADRLLQHDFLALVLQAVRGGARGMQESGVRALKHTVSSCSPRLATELAERVLERVEVVAVLVQAVRQWQSPLSELSAEVLTHLCLTLEHRLCLIQHGLLSVVLNHLAARRPSSSSSLSVLASFLACLRLLCCLCADNVYAVLFLSSSPLSAASPFAGLSITASSLFSFLSSLLLHADPQVKLYSSSILLTSALVHLSLSRRGQRGANGQQWAVHEEERWKRSELLRLHRDFHASPIGKRGRGGSDKGKKARDTDLDHAAFPLHPWIASLRPALVAALGAAPSPPPAAVQLLSSLLPRVLHVLTRLMESTDTELVAAVYPLLTAAVDGNEACQEEVGQVLPSLLHHLLHLTTSSAPPGSSASSLPLLAVLRLLHGLCAHETNRRVVLSIPAYSTAVLSLIMACPPRAFPLHTAYSLRILARLSLSHRFHLCETLSRSTAIHLFVLSVLSDPHAVVASSAMRAFAALLAPHTAQRRGLMLVLTPPITATLLSAAQGLHAESVEQSGVSDDSEGLEHASWRSVRLSALAALSAWCCRSTVTTQQLVVQGMGGWKRLVGLLEKKQSDDEEHSLLVATLHLLKHLLGSAAEQADARDMEDFTVVADSVDDKASPAAVVLSTSDLALLFSTLGPLLSTHSSSLSSTPPSFPPVADTLIEVVLNASAHPSCTSTLMLSSSSLLAFLLFCLRSPRSATREAAACTLTNALLTLANEGEDSLDTQRTDDTLDTLQPRAARRERQREVKGKRKRSVSSVSRRDDPAVGDRRKRRGGVWNGGGVAAAVDVEEDKSDDEGGMDVERVSSALHRFATSGLFTQLSHMRRQEEDQAVVERVKRILLLLQLLLQLIYPTAAAPTSSSSSSSSPSSSMLDDLRGIDLDLPSSPTLHVDDATLDAVFGERVGDAPTSLQRIMARMRDMGWREEGGGVVALDSEVDERKEGEDEDDDEDGDDDDEAGDDAELFSYLSPPSAPRSDSDSVGEAAAYPPSLSPLSIPWLQPALRTRHSLSSRLDSFMTQLRQVGGAEQLRHAPSSSPFHALRRTTPAGGAGGGGVVAGEGVGVLAGGEAERGGVSRQFREAVQLLDRRHRQIRAVADALGLAHPDRLRVQRRRPEEPPRAEEGEGMEQ